MKSYLRGLRNARVRPILTALSVLGLAVLCAGESSISVSSVRGEPSAKLQVSGSGFAPHTIIDLYFDARDQVVTRTNNSGSFPRIAIRVPASALPGKHWISAVERSRHVGAQIAFTVQSDWTEFHKQNMQRWNGVENVLSVKNVGQLRPKWRYTVNATFVSAITVANGVVYVGSDFGMYALNATTGKKLWQAIDSVWMAPAISNGEVYTPADDTNLYAVDAATGTILWNSKTNAPVVSSPTIVNGVVYVGSNDFNVYAINATTGARLWNYPTSSQVYASPAVVNGVVYACTSNPDEFYALNANTGALIWNVPIGCASTALPFIPLVSSPAVANGVVYVGSPNGTLYALQASTGATLWSYTTGAEILSAPAVANGIVYVGSEDANLYALKAKTGALVWKFTTGIDVPTAPAVANGVVYFGSNDGHEYALNANTGAKLWTSPYFNTSFNSPAVANGLLYIATGTTVVAYGLKTGGAAPDDAKPPSVETLYPDMTLKIAGEQVIQPAISSLRHK